MPLLVLAGLTPLVGVSAILILMPIIMYVSLLTLLGIGRRYGVDMGDPKGLVTSTFWEESDRVEKEPARSGGEISS